MSPEEADAVIMALPVPLRRQIGEIIESTWRSENAHKTFKHWGTGQRKVLLDQAKAWRKLAVKAQK